MFSKQIKKSCCVQVENLSSRFRKVSEEMISVRCLQSALRCFQFSNPVVKMLLSSRCQLVSFADDASGFVLTIHNLFFPKGDVVSFVFFNMNMALVLVRSS